MEWIRLVPGCIDHYWNRNSGFILSAASGSHALLVELGGVASVLSVRQPLLVVRSP